MTKRYSKPDEHSERVNDVLHRADTLTDELRRTISELTQILRSEPEGDTRA